jgi:RES domain-containing protein
VALLYRISHKSYLPQDPRGAAGTSEGRWHLLGQRVLYFSSSLPMCVLELRVNAISFEQIRRHHHYCAVDIDLMRKKPMTAPDSFYAGNWALHKPASQKFGGDWYNRNASLCLEVRSAVLSTEVNYIVNTAHPDFHSLVFQKSRPVPLDSRLD